MGIRRSSAAAPLFVIAVLVLLPIVYVSGFYLLGSIATAGPVRLHVYRYRWMSDLFTPAAQVESFLVGRDVVAVHPVAER